MTRPGVVVNGGAVLRRRGSISPRRRSTGTRVAFVEMFMAAKTLPVASCRGTAAERTPISSSWSTTAHPCWRTCSSTRRSSLWVVTVLGVRRPNFVWRKYSPSWGGCRYASNTRPMEVA